MGKHHCLVCTATGTGLPLPAVDDLFKMDSKCALRGADLTVIVDERLGWDDERDTAPGHYVNTSLQNASILTCVMDGSSWAETTSNI